MDLKAYGNELMYIIEKNGNGFQSEACWEKMGNYINCKWWLSNALENNENNEWQIDSTRALTDIENRQALS